MKSGKDRFSIEFMVQGRTRIHKMHEIMGIKEATKTDKSIIVTMITAMGLDRNEHLAGIQKVITLDQLFC